MTTREKSSPLPDAPVPQVSVIIPSYGCAATISHVLEALFRQTISPLEIIVVNDQSPDHLDEALRPYLDQIIYLKNEKNLGLAKTCNVGLRRASSDYVMTLHSDCILDPDYIQKLLAHLESDPAIGSASGQYLIDDVQGLARSDRIFLALNLIPIEKNRRDQSVNTINFIEGKADLFRKEVIARYGFFNENLVLTAEDQELSAKLRRDGFRLVQDSSCRFRVMFTETSNSIAKVLRKQRTYARGQVYVTLKFRRKVFAKTTSNREQRARHRFFQLTWSALLLAAIALAAFHPLTAAALPALLAIRVFFYFRASSFLSLPDRLLAAFLGPAADLLYFAGAVEGLVKTVLFRKT